MVMWDVARDRWDKMSRAEKKENKPMVLLVGISERGEDDALFEPPEAGALVQLFSQQETIPPPVRQGKQSGAESGRSKLHCLNVSGTGCGEQQLRILILSGIMPSALKRALSFMIIS